LSNDLFGTTWIFVFGIGATGHVGQVASVTGAMHPPACVVGEAVVASTAACNVAEGGVATGNEALMEPLPGAGIAGAVTDKEIVLVTHFDDVEV